MLLDDVEQTAWWSAKSIEKARAGFHDTSDHFLPISGVDPFVQEQVAGTSGYLYKPLLGKLTSYPIPELRLPDSDGELLLDIGCNWGRWSIAATRKGYRVIGIDPSLEAVLAARRVTHQLGCSCSFLVADARYLPFKKGSIDVVFSYSVIQHFSKEDARAALESIASVLKADGQCLIQMPNKFGIRSLYHLAKRGFSEGKEFDVRYYTVHELIRLFASIFGEAEVSVDGFFGLGIQPADIKMLPARYRAVVRASEALRHLSKKAALLNYIADSVYLAAPGTLASARRGLR